jgi:hypothetical protein
VRELNMTDHRHERSMAWRYEDARRGLGAATERQVGLPGLRATNDD